MPAAPAHPLTSRVITTEAELRALIGEPAGLTRAKISDRLNPMTRLFIERSPLVCIATSGPSGCCDLSPATGLPIPCATCWPTRTSGCSSSCLA